MAITMSRSVILLLAFSLLAICAASGSGARTVAAAGPAQAAPPLITLTPSSNYDGNPVTVSGTGFSPQDNSCTITSTTSPAGTQIIGALPSCKIGGGDVSGIFYVDSNNQPGYYTITVTGNTGDSASAPFTVESTQGSQSTQTTQTNQASQPGQVMTTTAVTISVNVTSTVTSTIASNVTTSTTSISTTNSTAGLVGGVGPDMNPVIVAAVTVICAIIGAAAVYAYMKSSDVGAAAVKAQAPGPTGEKKTEIDSKSAFCPGCGGRLPRHYSPCPINDSKNISDGADKGQANE